jgi:hypothetical protein
MTKALAFTPEFLRISYYFLRVTDYRLATTTDILPEDRPVKSYGATCRKTSRGIRHPSTSVMAFLAKTPLRNWMSKIEQTVAAKYPIKGLLGPFFERSLIREIHQ